MESQKFGCSASKKNRSRLPACDVQNVEKRKTTFPENYVTTDADADAACCLVT
jgi:hypothetical protein